MVPTSHPPGAAARGAGLRPAGPLPLRRAGGPQAPARLGLRPLDFAENGSCWVLDQRSEAPPLRRGCQDAIMASCHPRLRSAQGGSRFRTVFPVWTIYHIPYTQQSVLRHHSQQVRTTLKSFFFGITVVHIFLIPGAARNHLRPFHPTQNARLPPPQKGVTPMATRLAKHIAVAGPRTRVPDPAQCGSLLERLRYQHESCCYL